MTAREGWMPIDTAPKDEPVLVWIPGLAKRPVRCGTLSRIANGTMWNIEGEFGFDVGKPTYWHALPAPPTAA